MELSCDWRGFQAMFYPHRRTAALAGASSAGVVYLVVDNDVVVSAFSEHEDLSDWVGASMAETRTQSAGHRELIAFERRDVDKWIEESLTQKHFHEQVDGLRERAIPIGPKTTSPAQSFREHFLLEAISGWWGKVLPSSFGLFLRVEGQPTTRDLLLIVRRGEFAGFQEPDLSTLGAERRRQPADVVKYLSERHLVPVQGIFVAANDWQEWAQSANPWRGVARSVRANRAKLVPFRWGVAFLMATRAFLGV